MPIDKIRETLAEQLGVADATPEVQSAVIDEIGGLALQRLSLLMYTQLTEKDRGVFEALNEKHDASGMQTFIQEKIPNLEQLTQQAIATELAAFKEFKANLPQD